MPTNRQRHETAQRRKTSKHKATMERRNKLPNRATGLTGGAQNGAGPAASGIRVGFPAQRTVTLEYVQVQSHAQSVSGVASKIQFRLNSAFDPDYTGVGHQPMGYDQWAAFYNHYVVEECGYEVEVSSHGGDNSICGTYISDDATIPLTPEELVENGGTIAAHQAASTTPRIFKGKVNVSEFFNRSAIGADTQLRATVSADPIEQVFLSIWFQATTSNTLTIDAIVKLHMRVRFMEPKDLPPSALLARQPIQAKVVSPAYYKTAPALEVVMPVCDETASNDDFEFVRVRKTLRPLEN